jgi:hypothetical protein
MQGAEIKKKGRRRIGGKSQFKECNQQEMILF